MRPRMMLIGAAAVVATGLGVAVVAGGGSDSAPARASGLEPRTTTAGGVTVRLEPHHLDATGAEFVVTLDTHSEELNVDLVAGTELIVDGAEWPATDWDGDGPRGHHREGRLRFEAAGSAVGLVDLTLRGLSEPVAAQWTLGR